jgi:hypothetical protein
MALEMDDKLAIITHELPQSKNGMERKEWFNAISGFSSSLEHSMLHIF